MDETINSQFTEVITIEASVQAFVDSLAQLEAAYKDFLGRLGGSASEVSNVGAFASVQSELTNIRKSLDEFTAQGVLAFENLSKAALSNIQSVDEAQSASNAKQLQNLTKLAEAQALVNSALNGEGYTEKQIKFAQDIEIEQEGLINKLEERTTQFYRDLEIEQEGEVNRTAESRQQITAMYAKMFDDIEAKQAAQLKFAQDLAIEQEGEVNREAEAVRKLQLMYEQLWAKKDAEAEASAKRQEQLAQDIAIEQEGLVNKQAEQAAILEQRWNTVNAAVQKVNDSLRVTQLSNKPAEQLAELQKQLEAVDAELTKIKETQASSTSVGGVSVSEDNLANRERELALLKNKQSLIGEINTAERRANDDSKGFFAIFNDGIGQSIIALTRFTLVWGAIQTAIQVVTAIISAPFKAIQEGIVFLQQMETRAADLAPALLQNIKFSDDLAQNFVKATQAAKDLVSLIRDRSVVTGLDQNQITKLVEALVGSSAKQGVTNLQDMVTLAESFALAMKTSGLGTLSIQQQVNSIVKLFGGQLNEASSKYLQQLHLSTAEWENINTQGQLHGDLLQRLTPYIEKYQEANKLVGNTQQSLLNQLDLMKQKIEAVAAAPLFDFINDKLREMLSYLQENGDKISAVLQDLVKGMKQLAEEIASVAQASGALGVLADLFKFLAISVYGVFTGLTEIIASLKAIGEIAQKYDMITAFRPHRSDNDIVHEWSGAILQADKNLTDFYNHLYNPVNLPGNNKSSLTDPFQALGSPDVSKAQKGNQLRDAEIAYAEEIEKIKEKQRELIQSTQELVSAQKLSHKEAADKIKEYLDQEALAIAAANTKLETAAQVLKDQVNSATNTTSYEKAQATQKITDMVNLIEQRGATAHLALTAAISRETRQGYNDDTQAAREHFNALIKLTQDAAVQQLAIDKARLSEGLIVASQYYDEALKVAQDQYRNESITIAEQIEAHQHVPIELQKDLDKQAELDQAYTAKVKQLTEERKKAINDEDKAREDYYNKLKDLETASATEATAILNTLSGQNTTYITDQEMKLYEAKQRTLSITQQQKEADLERLSNLSSESKQVRQLTLDIQSLYNQRLQLLNQQLQDIQRNNPNSAIRNVLSTSAVNSTYAGLVDAENAANTALSRFQSSTTPGKPLTPDQALELDALGKAAHDAAAAVGQMQVVFDRLHPSISKLFSDFIGFDFKSAWNSAEGAIGKVAIAANAATEGLKTILNLASVYAQGAKQGGALGGAGAVISSVSSGPLGALLFGKDSIVSQFLPAIGGVLSFIGGLFTAAAQKIADNVKKSFQQTMDNYSNGNATLIETINTLEQQRAQAIASLSGKKGGQDQLNQLLPQFDQQIASLQKQQKDIITSFEQSLGLLQLHSDTLSTIQKQWEDINKQVTDYINAGGDMAKAAQYLSISLQNIQQDATNQLNDAQSQAIQDAMQLNDLLKQRSALMASTTQKVFDLTNADSIELMQAGSVSRGAQILTLEQQNQDQLDALNAQINSLTTKVDKERQIFNIASDTATLQQQSDALALQSLDQQISKWQDLQTIVASITQNGAGVFSGTGIFGGTTTTTNNTTTNISVTVTDTSGDPTQMGQQIADSITQQLARQARQASGYAQ